MRWRSLSSRSASVMEAMAAKATDGDIGSASGTPPYLARRRLPGHHARGMRLDEFLRHFVLAAAAADRRYARAQDPRDVHAGIMVWESLVEGGGLGESPPEELVDAHLAASMLYARRFEVQQASKDLALARRYLEYARAARPARFVCGPAGADVDRRVADVALPRRTGSRGSRGGDRDLDRSGHHRRGRAGGGQPRAGAAGPPRARSAIQQDLHDGRALLGHATEEMPADHPARADVELALRAAS